MGTERQNADCWASTNGALSQFPGCRRSPTEFLALFQCHLSQTSLGEWTRGFPSGLLQWLADVTWLARLDGAIGESPLLCFAKLMAFMTGHWLREHQGDDGLWDHARLSR